MNKLFECEVEFLPNPHLMQIYTGFFELQKMGVIDLKLKRIKYSSSSISIINAVIDKQHRVIYDVIDGLSWIQGDSHTNLEHFQKNFNTDFYFKRSYDPRMQQYRPSNCSVYPLGLNYNVQPSKNMFEYAPNLKDKIKYFAKTNSLLKTITKKQFFYTKDFEYYPIKPRENRILFLTRLWNPDEALSERSKEIRGKINATRIDCIIACREQYGNLFTGGLQIESYSTKNFPSLLMPDSYTNKRNYLQSVKDHSICITTTGLHNSIGWKLAEYVAASRAIVTEPLQFSLPGCFREGKNYLEFETAEQLVSQIQNLISNPDLLTEVMKNNYYYYNNFVKPERLILNTLLTIANSP